MSDRDRQTIYFKDIQKIVSWRNHEYSKFSELTSAETHKIIKKISRDAFNSSWMAQEEILSKEGLVAQTRMIFFEHEVCIDQVQTAKQSQRRKWGGMRVGSIAIFPLLFEAYWKTITTLVGEKRNETERLPQMADFADSILIFACASPDEAEAAVGDLLDRYQQVRARRSARISIAYFCWELMLLTVTKAKKRLVGATIGPILKKFFAGSG